MCTCTGGVYVSGILAMISCASLAIFSILSVIQLAMITSRDEVVLKYKTCVILKLALAIITGNRNFCSISKNIQKSISNIQIY